MYWKIIITSKNNNIGYVQFNDSMECVNIFDENGNIIDYPIEYTSIEFDVIPKFLINNL